MLFIKIGYLIFSLLLVTGNLILYPQDKNENHNDNWEGNFYYDIADSLWQIAEYDSSNFYFEKASSIFQRNGNYNKLVSCCWNIGVNDRYLGKYGKALNDLDKAIDIVNEYITDKDSILVEIYNSKGVTFYDLGNYDDAFKFYNKTLELSLKRFGDEHTLTGKGFHNVGLIYYRWGDVGKAMEYFQKALSIWVKTLGAKHSFIANCYTNIANILYLKGDVEKAIEYDEKALYIWKEKLGEKHPYVAYSYTNLASSYQYLGKLDKALTLEKKSFSIKMQIGKENPGLAENYINIGSIFTDLKQFDSAYFYLNKSRELQRLTKNKNHLVIATSYLRLAELSLKQNQYSESINYYDSALTFTYKKILSINSQDEVNYREIPRDEIFITSLTEKAEAFYLKYLNLSHNKNDLTNSLINYQIASQVIEHSRGEYFRDESKFVLSKKAANVNSKGLEISYELYRITKDDNYKIIAFEFAEKNKARILFDAINEAEAKSYSNIPDSLLNLEKNFKSQIAFYETKLLEAKEDNDSSLISENENKFFEVEEKYDKLKRTFENGYPEYHELKYAKPIVKVSRLQSLLGTNDALIEYCIVKNNLYIFTITRNLFRIDKIELDRSLNDMVISLRRSLLNLEFSEYLNTSFSLYETLFKPIGKILSNISKVYIIPDGILNYFPFEILLTQNIKSNNPDFSSLPYLINKYDISYQFSASLLNEMNLHSRKGREGKFIGIAPIFDEDQKEKNRINNLIDTTLITSANTKRSVRVNGSEYAALPETEREVMGILKLFLDKNRSGEYHLRKDAGEGLLKSSNIKNYGFIHLATHGFINEETPKLSGILFSEDEKNEDGILYSNEIYNLNLDADLVVLSACESGLGKVVRGEGIMGLTRGFLYSGANNVAVSLWQVGDKSTSKLMIYFYENILNGLSYSQSLREAKLRIIKEKKYAYPSEWGPFILIGNVD
ncbi:CHAT domain-containing protein [bacterium BMS3Abin03]|nr:CHAT domain-containing protein [bacterium BMS3Abin03]